MKRREFVGCGALAGVAGLAGPGAPATAADGAAFEVPAFELEEATVAGLDPQVVETITTWLNAQR